ncbi:hypothetical protein AOC36_10555 [Erysipelothrix larvae]|uniref:Uncharacterized protein n=1 Tax=Erysipelothrix larvae TaxID=1514105 RepID=A0A109UHK6_9FIRM|nr:hypothetical protein [Erysipelothrix larvae]AMC94395.1 hypothetical protein AOC36_10555 [Erysipelothrix larvae]
MRHKSRRFWMVGGFLVIILSMTIWVGSQKIIANQSIRTMNKCDITQVEAKYNLYLSHQGTRCVNMEKKSGKGKPWTQSIVIKNAHEPLKPDSFILEIPITGDFGVIKDPNPKRVLETFTYKTALYNVSVQFVTIKWDKHHLAVYFSLEKPDQNIHGLYVIESDDNREITDVQITEAKAVITSMLKDKKTPKVQK